MISKFAYHRGRAELEGSTATRFNMIPHTLRFCVSKTIALSALGFFGPEAAHIPDENNVDVRIRIYSCPFGYPLTRQRVIPPFIHQYDVDAERHEFNNNDDAADDVENRELLPLTFISADIAQAGFGKIFVCELENPVLIQKDTIIGIEFLIVSLHRPEQRFLGLSRNYPNFVRDTHKKSGTEFIFFGPSKQVASLFFDSVHEVEGAGAIYLQQPDAFPVLSLSYRNFIPENPMYRVQFDTPTKILEEVFMCSTPETEQLINMFLHVVMLLVLVLAVIFSIP